MLTRSTPTVATTGGSEARAGLGNWESAGEESTELGEAGGGSAEPVAPDWGNTSLRETPTAPGAAPLSSRPLPAASAAPRRGGFENDEIEGSGGRTGGSGAAVGADWSIFRRTSRRCGGGARLESCVAIRLALTVGCQLQIRGTVAFARPSICARAKSNPRGPQLPPPALIPPILPSYLYTHPDAARASAPCNDPCTRRRSGPRSPSC